MSETILDKILATKRVEVEALRARQNIHSFMSDFLTLAPIRPFADALVRPALIAEVKKASPSKGIIREDFDPVAVARAYEAGGATCLSVLTDKEYFQGDLSYLQAIRDSVKLPLLRKDFIIDALQIWEARTHGADAVLLIVAALQEVTLLREMRALAEMLGMDALVEVHNRSEMEIALESGATLIGINNRNLHTFEVRLETTFELIQTIPDDVKIVSESGIYTNADAQNLYTAGAHALLVGESLMRADDISKATRELLNAD